MSSTFFRHHILCREPSCKTRRLTFRADRMAPFSRRHTPVQTHLLDYLAGTILHSMIYGTEDKAVSRRVAGDAEYVRTLLNMKNTKDTKKANTESVECSTLCNFVSLYSILSLRASV
jgi:hypothetical protein